MISFTEDQLKQHSKTVSELFKQKMVKGPIHLCGGNEQQLIEIFKRIKDDDWVLSTHRNAYHALLKGVPEKELLANTVRGRCMHVYNRQHKVFTSAIVAGNCAIAVGIALAIKRSSQRNHVWCFVGDGATDSGHFFEAVRYAIGHKLPVIFVIEDNSYSVDTHKGVRWGIAAECLRPEYDNSNYIYYSYKREWPHCGCGEWITF